YDDVDPAVRIEVGHGQSHALPDVAANASVHRDFRERPVPGVGTQGVREATLQGRRAGPPLPGGSTSPGCLERPVEVVAHEEIQLAVPVVVEPGPPQRPRLLARGRNTRDTDSR